MSHPLFERPRSGKLQLHRTTSSQAKTKIKVKIKIKIKVKVKVKTHGGTAPTDDRGNSKQDHAHDPLQT